MAAMWMAWLIRRWPRLLSRWTVGAHVITRSPTPVGGAGNDQRLAAQAAQGRPDDRAGLHGRDGQLAEVDARRVLGALGADRAGREGEDVDAGALELVVQCLAE